MKSILDRSFRYTPSAPTDIRKLFRRIERELDEQKKRTAANEAEAARVVKPLIRSKP